ncbi:MAG: cytidylate kinase-like family protein [Bacteroidaceae bacterium]|nr:cytidylate kinase-like family protein [Bacteroidaceae bacterium]
MIITVGRQIGSGGHNIGKKLAEELGYKFYDMEILALAAEESGFDRKFFEKNDEKHGFFRSIFGGSVLTGAMMNYADSSASSLSQEGLFRFLSEAIQKAAGEDNCIFVGRCADYILRDFPNVVSVFVTADYEERVQAVMQRKEMTREQAEKHIREKEDSRASFYNYYTGKTWGHSASYDLCVNSSKLGQDKTVEYIKQFVANIAK